MKFFAIFLSFFKIFDQARGLKAIFLDSNTELASVFFSSFAHLKPKKILIPLNTWFRFNSVFRVKAK